MTEQWYNFAGAVLSTHNKFTGEEIDMVDQQLKLYYVALNTFESHHFEITEENVRTNVEPREDNDTEYFWSMDLCVEPEIWAVMLLEGSVPINRFTFSKNFYELVGHG